MKTIKENVNTQKVTQHGKLYQNLTFETPMVCDRDDCAGSPYAAVKVLCANADTGEVQDRVLPIALLTQILQLGEQLIPYCTDGDCWNLTFQAIPEYYERLQQAQSASKK